MQNKQGLHFTVDKIGNVILGSVWKICGNYGYSIKCHLQHMFLIRECSIDWYEGDGIVVMKTPFLCARVFPKS